MSTNYQLIYDRFMKKIKGDKQFLNYKGLVEEEIDEIVSEHLLSLLNRAIDKVYSVGMPDIDLHDKNDELLVFNKKLVPQEISLLSDVMYLVYMEEDLNKLKALGAVFRTSEINVIASPANERKTYLELVTKIKSDVDNSISNYFSRDRKTWKFKSVYGDSV